MAGKVYEATFETNVDGPAASLFQSALEGAKSQGATVVHVIVSGKIRDNGPNTTRNFHTYGYGRTHILQTLDDSVRSCIRDALDATHGNKTEAAKILGLKRTTLVEKMKRLGMM